MKLISTKEFMLLSFLLSFPILLFSMGKSKTMETSFDKEILSKSNVNFSLFLDETNPSCMTCTDGSISVSTVGGLSPFNYIWSDGSTNSNLNNVGNGTYTVSVTDILGCQEIGTMTLNTVTTVFGVEVLTLGVGCYGDTTGNAVAQVTDGMMPFQYLWSNGDTTSTSSNLAQGNYSMTVTDATGATASDDFMINSPDSLVVFIDPTVGCDGGNSGSATLIITGGSFPFSFVWSNGDSVQTATNLSTGNHAATITDGNGCIAVASAIFLNQPIELNSNPFPTSTSCPGGIDGAVALDVWGGSGVYDFNWSNGETTQNLNAIPAGSYTITITDTNGCINTSEVEVDGPTPIGLNVQGLGITSCNGASDGSIAAGAFGGNPGYTYAWSNGATGNFIESLAAGTYFVTITDVIGCTGTGSAVVNEPEILEAFTFGSSVCNGSDDGTATVVTSGGTQPYNYSWSNGATTAEIENLTLGTYYVTVSDLNQCVVEDSIMINLNTNALISNPSSTMSCSNDNSGTATITPTGGNAPYTYLWSTGAVDSMITNLAPGTYTVTVVDFFNCSFIETYNIIQPDPIEINATIVNATCGLQNGIVYLNPTGGTAPFTYEWSNGSIADSLANLDGGAYAVNVSDANGCIKQFFVDVSSANNPPNVITQNISVSLDNSGQATIDATQIDNGSSDDCGINMMFLDVNSFDCSNLGANTVTLTVMDAGNVSTTGTASVTVIDDMSPTATSQNITLSLDMNGAVTLTANQVDNGSADNCGIDGMSIDITQFDCSNIGDNSVMLTVMDASGNSNSTQATVTIVDDSAPTILTQNITISLDAMGMAQINMNQVNNGSTDNCGIDAMSIDITQFDCSNVGDNSVMLTISDINGNSNSAEAIVTVLEDSIPTILTQNVTISLDAMGMAQLDVNQIDNGSTDNCGIDSMSVDISTFDCSNIGDNLVTLTVMDASGNSNSAEATVTIIDDLAPTIITQNVTIYLDAMGMSQLDLNQVDNGSADNCGIDSMSVDISSFDCSNLGDNTVMLTVMDASGNMQSEAAIITVVDTIAATFSCPTDILIQSCDSVTIVDYTVGDVIDNCSAGDPVLVSGIPSGGELSTGTVTNVYEYTDQAGNVTTCSFNITLSTIPEIEVQLDSFTPATDGNSDGSIEITITLGTGPFQFEWTSNGVVVSTDEDPTGLPAGNYELVVTGLDGCMGTLQVEVTTGIQDPELLEKVNLFPNPTSDILFVQMDLPIQSGDKIQLYSIDGKVLLEKNLNDGDELIEMNVANFASGIYIMQLTVNQGVLTKRVIIQD